MDNEILFQVSHHQDGRVRYVDMKNHAFTYLFIHFIHLHLTFYYCYKQLKAVSISNALCSSYFFFLEQPCEVS